MRPKHPLNIHEVRPIGARALKSAIDTLRPWLAEASVLDLFAGQGRFGIAALGEGADEVTFVELSRPTATEIKKSVKRFGPRARVENTDVFKFAEKAALAQKTFDIIFADPPFPLWSPEFSKKLGEAMAKLTTPTSIFLVKHPAKMLPSASSYGLTEWKTTPFGESKLIYFKSP